MRSIVRIALALGTLSLAAALVVPAVAQQRLPAHDAPPVVLRIPAIAAQPSLPSGLDAPLITGEFTAVVRTRSDRAALADVIARQRYAESQRWAKQDRGIVVQLRRPRS